MNQENKDEYMGFSLKKDLVQAMEEHVNKDPSYSSITEFIRTAVREKLQRLNGGGT